MLIVFDSWSLAFDNIDRLTTDKGLLELLYAVVKFWYRITNDLSGHVLAAGLTCFQISCVIRFRCI